MSFFDDLTKKAKVVAATASEKAKDAADARQGLRRYYGGEAGTG